MTDTRIAMSIPEAAKMLGIGKSKMYELIKQEDCDFLVKIGKRTLVSRARLEAWLDRQATKAG